MSQRNGGGGIFPSFQQILGGTVLVLVIFGPSWFFPIY